MFRKSPTNPASVCVLLGGRQAAASTQEIGVLLRRQPMPPSSRGLVTRMSFNRDPNPSVWSAIDKLRFFLFG